MEMNVDYFILISEQLNGEDPNSKKEKQKKTWSCI